MFVHDFYFYKNVYSNDELSAIREIIESAPASYTNDTPAPGKNVDVKIVDMIRFNGTLNKFFGVAIETNQRIYGFDLFPHMPSFINTNIYREGVGEYKYHRDAEQHGHKNDYKLTVLMNISDETYEGGKFEIFLGHDRDCHIEALDNPGSVVIIPSFLYHRVTPVTKGTRKTISAWIQGPGFK